MEEKQNKEILVKEGISLKELMAVMEPYEGVLEGIKLRVNQCYLVVGG